MEIEFIITKNDSALDDPQKFYKELQKVVLGFTNAVYNEKKIITTVVRDPESLDDFKNNNIKIRVEIEDPKENKC